MRFLNAILDLPRPGAPVAPPHVEVFHIHEHTIAFDANSLTALSVDGPEAEAIRAGDSRGWSEGGILFSTSEPQLAPPTTRVQKLVLNVTARCNLRCRYCFVQRERDIEAKERDTDPCLSSTSGSVSLSAADMSLSTALSALSLFGRQRVDVSFFGGEPLLCWPLLQDIMRAGARKERDTDPCLSSSLGSVSLSAPASKPRPRWHITSNGTLITAAIAALSRLHSVSWLISLDGPVDVHERIRPMPHGDSFDATIRGIRALNAAGIRPLVRATFDSPNPDLAYRLDFFAQLVRDGMISGADIEPAIMAEGCVIGRQPPSADTAVDLAARYHEMAIWYAAQIRAGAPFDFPPFRKALKRLLYRQPMSAQCGGGLAYLAVAPDGALHACHKLGCPVGHVRYGIAESLREPWRARAVYSDPACVACWARWLCGGGCRHHRLTLGGALTKNAAILCDLRKMLLKESLWILATLGPDRLKEIIKP